MLNLKTRIREAYRAFVNPYTAISNADFVDMITYECMSDARKQSGSSRYSVGSYTSRMVFSQEEIQQSIAENQRKAGM